MGKGFVTTAGQKLETFSHSIRRMTTEADAPSMMRTMVDSALRQVSASAGAWGVYEDGAILFEDYRSADGVWHVIHERFTEDRGVPGWIMRNREAFVANDPLHDDRTLPELIHAYGIRNFISIPILNREGGLLGLFELHNKANGADFTQEDLVLLTALSSTAAVILGFDQMALQAEFDHAQREQIQTELNREREGLIELFQQAPAFIAVLRGPDHVFERINPQYQKLIGFRHVLGKPVREAVPEVIAQGFIEVLDRVYRTGIPFSAHDLKITLARVEGAPMEDRYLDFVYQPIGESNGRTSGIIALGIDITERRLAEVALQKSREHERQSFAELEAIYRTAPIGLALFDPVEFRYLRLNARQAEIVGLPISEILGKGVTEIAPIPGLQEMFEQVARGIPVKDALLEGELPNRPGDHRYWTVNYDPVYGESGKVEAISAASLEITAQKRAELALIQNEKLAAAGRLAASIAHEINNPLEAVTNLLFLIQRADSMAEAKQYASIAQIELGRVAELTQRTLRFHRQSTRPAAVCVSELLDSVLAFYQGRLTSLSVRVERRYRDVPIVCYESELRQVINNLIGNALDALQPGGVLSLRTSVATHWKTGRRGIRVTVADTGHGMDNDTRKRIFEPFFTTKAATGTGLGLWVTCEILKRHEGTMKVRSSQKPGMSGSAFSIFLPFEHKNLEAPPVA